ncbi:minor capsid protein [Clostridium baratii]|uniref:minor capsid protein n=1 Tax=Clostridium baratii TaxID=1561 RepID=UPI0030D3121E
MKIFSNKIKGFDKLTKEQQFFVANFLNLTEESHKINNKCFNDVESLQNKNIEELLRLIADIMLKYDIDNNKMNINLSEQRQLIKELDKKINELMKGEYENENKILTNKLIEVSKDQYNVNNYLLSLGMSFELKKISDKNLKRILNTKIKGKNYSDRIWDNRDYIAKKLKVHIRDFLGGETNCNKIEKEIRNRFKVDKNLSKRLVGNEIARVQNAANEQWFEDNEVEYLLYSATLDSRTCSICAEDDGKVFKSNDSNRPNLPRHVGDRCTYSALPNKNYRPDFRINNEIKEDISYKTYKEWVKDNDS